MKRSVAVYLLFAVLFTSVCILAGRSAVRYAEDNLTPAYAESESPVFVIDPGHGGEDGGASSGDILEKDLNLTVSRNLADICTIFGQDILLTRNSDRMLYDAYGDFDHYSGRKKTYDLKNRLRMAEESGAALFISIHMNKFPLEKYRGLQVYYSVNDQRSQTAANLIQNYSRTYLMPWNERQIKSATSSIYLLHRISRPAVLVECGFLSNPEDCACLTDRDYQVRLTCAVFAAVSEWLIQ